MPTSLFRVWRLHKFESDPIRFSNIDHTFSGVRARSKGLRFAGGAPAEGGDGIQNSLKVIDHECDVDRSNVARPDVDLFAVIGCEIFKQLDFVPVTLQNSDKNFSSRNTGDFAGELTGVMCAMRKLETENIAPESEGTLEIRNRNAGVISCDDVKRHVFRKCSLLNV